MMTAQIHVEPTDYDWHGTIGAHGDKKKRGVLRVRLVVYSEKDCKSGDGDEDGDQGEGKSVLGFVGEECNDHSEDEGARPWRNAVQLGAGGTVSVTPNNSRGKKCIATSGLARSFRKDVFIPIGWHNQSKVHEATNEDFEVPEDIDDIFYPNFTFCGITALIFS